MSRITFKVNNQHAIKVKSFSELTAAIDATGGNGRLAMSGENGSGKTTILVMLKSHYGNEAFLLPTNKSILAVGKGKMSVGQLKLKELSFIAKTGHKYLLLDEWNANLDAEKAKAMGTVIAEVAQSMVVIEVIHHHSQ